jgi:RNA polymerase sigma-70 factor, ECF subfamily
VARFSELSHIQLVQECAGSRNADAWAEFIRRFQPVIAAAVLRTARQLDQPPHQLIDDLVQETYLKLCENEGRLLCTFQLRGKDSIFGYLKVVAANIVRDHYKSDRAEKRGAGQTEALNEIVQMDLRAKESDGEDCIHRTLQLKQIDEILRQVTAGKDQQRKCAIFWLRHQRGFTASEIASLPEIGLSTEGVESVLLRLTIMIRTHIQQDGKVGKKKGL